MGFDGVRFALSRQCVWQCWLAVQQSPTIFRKLWDGCLPMHEAMLVGEYDVVDPLCELTWLQQWWQLWALLLLREPRRPLRGQQLCRRTFPPIVLVQCNE